MQSARVYRSYLRKLQQQNQKSTLENQRLEKASEELSDRTHNITSGFCNWVQSIGGDDPNCNPTEEAILNWFAVGQDALEVEDKEKEIENSDSNHNYDHNHTRTFTVADVKHSHNHPKKRNDTRPTILDGHDSNDDLVEIELKKMELESKLQDLTSTSLFNEFRCRMSNESAA